MTPAIAFTCLVALVAVQRLLELRRSKKNERLIISEGGCEHAPGHYRVMQAVHGGWFAGMMVEVWWMHAPFIGGVAAVAFVVFVVGQYLRHAARRALGWRWTVRILTPMQGEPVTTGIYRYMRHPNYVGVVLEIAALPLVHGALYTAIVFSLANAVLLSVRIRCEERALCETMSYAAAFGARPRWISSRPRRLVES